MSKETILNNLNTSIRLEVLPNEAKEDPVAFVNTLIYNKHDKVSTKHQEQQQQQQQLTYKEL